MTRLRSRFPSVVLSFDLQDRYARDLMLDGPRPRPMGPIWFDVLGTSSVDGPQRWKSPLRLSVVRNDGGHFLWFGGLTSHDGTRLRNALAPGNYLLRISSPTHIYQTIEHHAFEIPAPDAPPEDKLKPFDLEPGHAYPFPLASTLVGGKGVTLLRGGLRRTDGSTIAGASVEAAVPNVGTFRTDDIGEWVLAFPDEHPTGVVTLTVTVPNDDVPLVMTVTDVAVEQGRTSSLQQAALRGRVVDGDGVGVAGVTVAVTAQEGQARTDDDGLWAYYFPLDQMGPVTISVTATHPDGRTLTRPDIEAGHRETTLVPVFGFT